MKLFYENGSSDGTPQIAEKVAEKYEDIHYLKLDKANLFKAMKVGFNLARADKIAYIPMDLSLNLGFISESYKLLDYFDAVLGSKRLALDLDHRPFTRRVLKRTTV